MAESKLPSYNTVSDAQIVQVTGANGGIFAYEYDKEQRAYIARDTQYVATAAHGLSHISTDPIPAATCDNPGLMSADDKCKLETITQTRIGVLSFQGAGFPDDGGWLSGDIILAAGTEFISLERFGNVVRFTVDSPVPMNCSCEACTQIFWVQDETDVSAIRPPTCGGKIPGVNGYGELKFYIMPANTLVNPSKPSDALNTKGRYPSLIFKRYDNALTPGSGSFEVVLSRDTANQQQGVVGWNFTPGTTTVATCEWLVGKDTDGNLMKFSMKGNATPGLLGSITYKGHNITKKMAIVTDYASSVVSTNQYKLKWWDILNSEPLGDEFTATNIWQYTDAGVSTQELVLDNSRSLLPIGALVDVWFFEIGSGSAGPIYRYYFNVAPPTSAASTWSQVGGVVFGNTLTSRQEIEPSIDDTDRNSAEDITSLRDLERTIWGVSNYHIPLVLESDGDGGYITSEYYNGQNRAEIDLDLPGLKVEPANETGNFSQRPVHLWNRVALSSSLTTIQLGRGTDLEYPTYDVLLAAPIDSYEDLYLRVKASGSIGALYYVRVSGVQYKDLPQFGTLRILGNTGTSASEANSIWSFTHKAIDNVSSDESSVTLIGTVPYPGTVDDLVEMLHQEYSCPCVRVQFTEDDGEIQLQFKVGTLSMSDTYENDNASDDVDDYVRGLADGYSVSAVYTQAASWSGLGPRPSINVDGFYVVDGGSTGTVEYWNELEIMQRGGQIWIWWNGLLIPPDTDLSADLDVPSSVSTPYFPVAGVPTFGKVGLRMWPGATVRSIAVRGQNREYSEYTRGQLLIT